MGWSRPRARRRARTARHPPGRRAGTARRAARGARGPAPALLERWCGRRRPGRGRRRGSRLGRDRRAQRHARRRRQARRRARTRGRAHRREQARGSGDPRLGARGRARRRPRRRPSSCRGRRRRVDRRPSRSCRGRRRGADRRRGRVCRERHPSAERAGRRGSAVPPHPRVQPAGPAGLHARSRHRGGKRGGRQSSARASPTCAEHAPGLRSAIGSATLLATPTSPRAGRRTRAVHAAPPRAPGARLPPRRRGARLLTCRRRGIGHPHRARRRPLGGLCAATCWRAGPTSAIARPRVRPR
jgi:hypothetical protein